MDVISKSSSSIGCFPGEFYCKSTGYCISIEQVCDGINHCWYGDDETFCQSFKPKGFFKCKHQQKYINISRVCDGIVNCLNGNDEFFCQNRKSPNQKISLPTFVSSKLLI